MRFLPGGEKFTLAHTCSLLIVSNDNCCYRLKVILWGSREITDTEFHDLKPSVDNLVSTDICDVIISVICSLIDSVVENLRH